MRMGRWASFLMAWLSMAPLFGQQTAKDEHAIKKVLDDFSILADRFDVETQMTLFTEDAVVESIQNGNPGSTFEGKEAIGSAFSNFLHTFSAVYHLNGQQMVTIHGSKAHATSYCQVLLVQTEGVAQKIRFYIRYEDDFVKEGGRWLIQHRTSHFIHTEIVSSE